MTWTFDDNADDWIPANGDWEVQDGVYKQTLRWGKAQKALAGTVELTDHTIEAKVRVESGHWAGIVFRAQMNLSTTSISFAQRKQVRTLATPAQHRL